MQLPAILIATTEIQATVAKELSAKGIAYALFPQEMNAIDEIAITLKKIMGSSSIRTSMSQACRDFLDVDGVSRVVNNLLEFKDANERKVEGAL